MAYVQHNGRIESLKTASAIGDKTVVKLNTVEGEVVALATNNAEPLGLTCASALVGEQVTVYEQDNIVKAVAAASLGFGGIIGVASTNGNLGPVSGASGISRWAVGVSREDAAAGETFSLLVDPRQLSNLI